MSLFVDMGRFLDTSPFQPSAVRYIKLGQEGAWAARAFKDGILPFGYRGISHEDCLAGDWEAVRQQLLATGRTPAGASQGIREIKDFYLRDDQTLWFIFAAGHLYWCFAEAPPAPFDPAEPDGPTRYRRVRGTWRRDDLNGRPLETQSLSSALTSTAAYRMTICDIKRPDYLLRRIRGEKEPVVAKAEALLSELGEVAATMIQQLHWADFETLVELIFTRDGWQRVSVLGKTQEDVDLLLEHHTSGQRAWVQIKAHATQSHLNDYLARFEANGAFDRFYFVCGSASEHIKLPGSDTRREVWQGKRLADASIAAGLLKWLIERTG